MAEFIHSREHLNRGNIVQVDCDTQCNVMLLSDTEFSNYRRGNRFKYYGGHYKRFPVRIPVPNSGYWNIIIDLGGGSARIKHAIQVIKI
jgi:hypothetical protein